MPLTTMKTRTHTLYVWTLLPGDVAHPDGYAVVSVDEISRSAVTMPLDTMDEF